MEELALYGPLASGGWNGGNAETVLEHESTTKLKCSNE